MPSTVLRAKDLGFAYPQRRLFQELSFELPPGLSLIRGGDGSGKTTLLRLLAGDLPSDGGALWLKGVSLSEQPLPTGRRCFGWITKSLAWTRSPRRPTCPSYLRVTPILTMRVYLR